MQCGTDDPISRLALSPRGKDTVPEWSEKKKVNIPFLNNKTRTFSAEDLTTTATFQQRISGTFKSKDSFNSKKAQTVLSAPFRNNFLEEIFDNEKDDILMESDEEEKSPSLAYSTPINFEGSKPSSIEKIVKEKDSPRESWLGELHHCLIMKENGNNLRDSEKYFIECNFDTSSRSYTTPFWQERSKNNNCPEESFKNLLKNLSRIYNNSQGRKEFTYQRERYSDQAAFKPLTGKEEATTKNNSLDFSFKNICPPLSPPKSMSLGSSPPKNSFVGSPPKKITKLFSHNQKSTPSSLPSFNKSSFPPSRKVSEENLFNLSLSASPQNFNTTASFSPHVFTSSSRESSEENFFRTTSNSFSPSSSLSLEVNEKTARIPLLPSTHTIPYSIRTVLENLLSCAFAKKILEKKEEIKKQAVLLSGLFTFQEIISPIPSLLALFDYEQKTPSHDLSKARFSLTITLTTLTRNRSYSEALPPKTMHHLPINEVLVFLFDELEQFQEDIIIPKKLSSLKENSERYRNLKKQHQSRSMSDMSFITKSLNEPYLSPLSHTSSDDLKKSSFVGSDPKKKTTKNLDKNRFTTLSREELPTYLQSIRTTSSQEKNLKKEEHDKKREETDKLISSLFLGEIFKDAAKSDIDNEKKKVENILKKNPKTIFSYNGKQIVNVKEFIFSTLQSFNILVNEYENFKKNPLAFVHSYKKKNDKKKNDSLYSLTINSINLSSVNNLFYLSQIIISLLNRSIQIFLFQSTLKQEEADAILLPLKKINWNEFNIKNWELLQKQLAILFHTIKAAELRRTNEFL